MDPFEHTRGVMTDGQTFGIWSLIVTFFGDMALQPGDKVPGSVLTGLGEKLAIKPEAMRVALHRLRKDGWIDSLKSGRHSAYFLTETSRRESEEAAAKIYATQPPEFFGVHILLVEEARSFSRTSHAWLPLGAEVCVSFKREPVAPKNAIQTTFRGEIPEWIPKRILPSEVLDGYKNFNTRMAKIEHLRWSNLTPIENAAIRVLLVHGWRRLVLKHPVFPDQAYPSDCPIKETRGRLFELLEHAPRPQLNELG